MTSIPLWTRLKAPPLVAFLVGNLPDDDQEQVPATVPLSAVIKEKIAEDQKTSGTQSEKTSSESNSLPDTRSGLETLS